MTLEADLLAWFVSRPGWQRNVLARLCRQETFDDAAVAAIADCLVGGGATPTGDLSAADIPGNPVASSGVRLTALRDLTGVNALAPDQTLTFGATGITIIYGDNASGKSGYARVLKTAVGTRAREDILGDVFTAGISVPQSAVIDYRLAYTGPDQQWKMPGDPNSELQQLHFYDEVSGDAYLVAESEITYRPSALVLLDQLIAVCDAVRAKLDERLRATDATRPPMPVVPKGTSAARFLASLKSTTTDEDISTACAAPADANGMLGRFLSEEARLKASDPTRERDHLTALAANQECVAKYCDHLAALLSAEGLERLARLRTSATELRAAAKVASSQSFDTEPVPGVGSSTWRVLWEAARAFSEAEAYHGHEFPVVGDAHCVLCHQELSAAAGDRLSRFHAFMTDTTERDAAKSEEVLATERQAVHELALLPPAVATASAQLRAADTALADTGDAWIGTANARAAATVNWLDGVTDEQPAPTIAGPGKVLTERARQLRGQAATIDATSFAQRLQAVSTQAADLQGQIAIAASKGAIEQEVRRLRVRAQIEAVRKGTDTGAITRKSSDLTRAHVTREVRDQFTRESERLRLRHITLDDTSGVKGRLLHRPTLLGAARSAAVTSVLSEGEQTALGLSGFFTEAMFDATKSAVVLDDPVTSLDHGRRSLVAERLVQLAADRQVVVFTHEVSFVGDLVRHATEAKVLVTERWVQRTGDIVGVCADKHPWKAKDVAARINSLEGSLARIKRDRASWDQERYEESCASWAGQLSETWERAVNLEVVNEVVDRATSEVRPRMFRMLAAITQQDNDEFQAGYGRCSQWARRHDKAPELNYVAPEPDDMLAEVERLRRWFKRIKGYRS